MDDILLKNDFPSLRYPKKKSFSGQQHTLPGSSTFLTRHEPSQTNMFHSGIIFEIKWIFCRGKNDIGPAYHLVTWQAGNPSFPQMGTARFRWFRDLAGLLPDEECATWKPIYVPGCSLANGHQAWFQGKAAGHLLVFYGKKVDSRHDKLAVVCWGNRNSLWFWTFRRGWIDFLWTTAFS